MEMKQIANHDQFHKNLKEKGLEMTIDQTHQEIPLSIPQHEAQINHSDQQQHHQADKETQTPALEEKNLKSLYVKELTQRKEYEQQLQSVYELLTQWERSGNIGKSCFAQEMRTTLASKR